MYRTSYGSEKCGNGRRQNQGRVPVTIHWSKEFGIWTQDIETSGGSIPNGEDDLIFTTYAFRKVAKESLPTTTKRSVIYYYACACEAAYVGKTTQQLTERIKQHISDKISNNGVKRTDSAILVHLKSNHSCIPGEKEHAIFRFAILATERSQCHLNVLGAVSIKSLSPSMCLQK